MKTTTELRKLDQKGLKIELNDAEKELFKIRFDVNNNESKSIHLISKLKKYIARIKTLLREKTLISTPEPLEAEEPAEKAA